ncbi:hypothetical protein KCP70_19770 [Salmonella enterica subsp. enterica]|nr:hypothetical protein KCP70_19770 [Salmonella enterica subsp. enterica]
MALHRRARRASTTPCRQFPRRFQRVKRMFLGRQRPAPAAYVFHVLAWA